MVGYSFVSGDFHPLPFASSPGAPEPNNPWHFKLEVSEIFTEDSNESISRLDGTVREYAVAMHREQPTPTFRIPITDDALASPNTRLRARLVSTEETHPSVSVLDGITELIVKETDTYDYSFDIDCDESYEVTEGEGHLKVNIVRTPNVLFQDSMLIVAFPDSARQGADFDHNNTRRLVFPPRAESVTVNIGITDDALLEDEETFKIQMLTNGFRDLASLKRCEDLESPNDVRRIAKIFDDDRAVIEFGDVPERIVAGEFIQFFATANGRRECVITEHVEIGVTHSGPGAQDITGAPPAQQQWRQCTSADRYELALIHGTRARGCPKQGEREVRFEFSLDTDDERITLAREEQTVQIIDEPTREHAVKFTTGANANGYELTTAHAELLFTCQSRRPTLQIWSSGADGTPGYRIWDLAHSGTNRGHFTAESGARLEPETDYFVVLGEDETHQRAEMELGSGVQLDASGNPIAPASVVPFPDWSIATTRTSRQPRDALWEDTDVAGFSFSLDADVLGTPQGPEGRPDATLVSWDTSFTVGNWHARGKERERGWRVQACEQTRADTSDIEDHSDTDICYGSINDRTFTAGTTEYELEGIYHFVTQGNDSLVLEFTEHRSITALLDRTFLVNGLEYAVSERVNAPDDSATTRSIIWAAPQWTATMGWTVGADVWLALKNEETAAAREELTVNVQSEAPDTVHGPFEVEAKFSAQVTELSERDFETTNATITPGSLESSDHQTWTVQVAPAADGPVTVTLPEGAANAGEQQSEASETMTREADLSAPTATLTSTTRTLTEADVEVRITFSKRVSGLELADIEIEGGSAFALLAGPAGDVFQVFINVAQTADTLTVSVPAAAVADDAGRANIAAPAWRAERERTGGGDALTAAFEDLPAHHDGATAFTFKLRFSETPEELGYATVRDTLLLASGARITGARRERQGSNKAWVLTAKPTSGGDITLTLPVRACTEANAVCAQGRTLAAPVSATVRATPLTATLTQVPKEHDASTPFTFTVTFSIEPSLSYTVVRDTMFTVAGGTITGARRLTAGDNTRFAVTIRPSGTQAVGITLTTPLPACGEIGAICTADGRALQGTLSATVPGPAALSVADTTVQEADGAQLVFSVTLDRERDGAVTVDYATSDGTASSGEDYTARAGTLTFATGQTAKRVEIEVLDDAHDEGDETMMVTLSNPNGARIARGTATGTIQNTDAMPKAWMVRFARTVASQIVDAVSHRTEGGHGQHVTVAGIAVMGAPARAPDPTLDNPFAAPAWPTPETGTRTMTGDDLRRRSSFHLTTRGRDPIGPAFALWGRAATGHFESEVDDIAIEGDVTTTMMGVDGEWRHLLGGVMLTHSTGEGAYRPNTEAGKDSGRVESDLTGLYPYARADLDGRVSAWGLAGAAGGNIALKREGGRTMQTGLSMRMGAVGVKGQVLDGSGPSGIGLNVRSDFTWVGTRSARSGDLARTQGNTTRTRLIVEGERTLTMHGGATLVPAAELGLRLDGGDAETGAGIEAGARVRYVSGPLTIEGQVRMLVAHEDDGYEEWGASGAIRLTPRASGRGWSLSITPQWGRAGSATQRLWSAGHAAELENDTQFEATGRIAMHAGYGFGVGAEHGVLTPYTSSAFGDGGRWTVRSGVQWQLDRNTTVKLEAGRQGSDESAASGGVGLQGAMRF